MSGYRAPPDKSDRFAALAQKKRSLIHLDVMMRTTGTDERSTVAGESVEAFVPHPLPPTEPPLNLGDELAPLLARAGESVRLLELAGDLVPSVEWFVYAFVRKEAVLSAQIEGTQATLMDLLEVEASGEAPADADIEEVCGYVDALNFAWDQFERPDGLPLSMRLLSETHARLLIGVRGAQKQPGDVRRSQNWIGGTRPGNAAFVPPPPHRLDELLSAFERAIHDDSVLPPLVRVGLLHVQFETLHPYLDGNGRLGRLVITLLLRHWGLLTRPLLYLSLFLKMHRQEYSRRLSAVRAEGDWEGWLASSSRGSRPSRTRPLPPRADFTSSSARTVSACSRAMTRPCSASDSSNSYPSTRSSPSTGPSSSSAARAPRRGSCARWASARRTGPSHSRTTSRT
jgi:Fic family protein